MASENKKPKDEDIEDEDLEELEADGEQELEPEGESDVDGEAKPEVEATEEDEAALKATEEKRERRRLEKQDRNRKRREAEARDKARIAQLERTIADIQAQQEQTQTRQGSIELGQIQVGIRESAAAYHQAGAEIKQSIVEGDGEKHHRALEARDAARDKWLSLTAAEKKITEQPNGGQTKRTQTSQPNILASGWMSKNSSWFGKDQLATNIAKAVDNAVANEGYDKNSSEYFEELDRRLALRIPEHYEQSVPKPKARQMVGGSGANSGGGVKVAGRYSDLPKEYVKACQEAGMWEDDAMKKEMAQRYYKEVRGNA